jgi:hypothetical protein
VDGAPVGVLGHSGPGFVLWSVAGTQAIVPVSLCCPCEIFYLARLAMAKFSTFRNIKASFSSTPAELAAESVEGINGQQHWDNGPYPADSIAQMDFIHLHNVDLHNGHVDFAKWFYRLPVV